MLASLNKLMLRVALFGYGLAFSLDHRLETRMLCQPCITQDGGIGPVVRPEVHKEIMLSYSGRKRAPSMD